MQAIFTKSFRFCIKKRFIVHYLNQQIMKGFHENGLISIDFEYLSTSLRIQKKQVKRHLVSIRDIGLIQIFDKHEKGYLVTITEIIAKVA